MCYISMVMDDYSKRTWPWVQPQPDFKILPLGSPEYKPIPITNITTSILSKEDLNRLENLIKEFKEAVNIANRLDVLTKKPDCIDPEKEKLIARVAELEEQINTIKEIVARYTGDLT